MKKILFIVALFATMMLTSCKDKCQFLQTLQSDYAEVVAAYPSTEGHLREVQMTLTDSLHIANPKTVDVESALEIYQAEDTTASVPFVVFRQKAAGTPDDTYMKAGIWVGSSDANPNDFKVNVPDAIRALKNAGVELPPTTLVTLRLPVIGVPYENPLYIFGSKHTFYICVDVVTGEVLPLGDDFTLSDIQDPVEGPAEAEAE